MTRIRWVGWVGSRRWLGWLAAALVVAAGAAAWLSRAPAAPAVSLVSQPLVRTLQFSARVTTLSRVDVGSTVTGRVAEVLVAEGAEVRRDAPLVRLDSAELRAALAQARANERQAEARLAGLRSSGRTGVRASVAQADSVLVAARAELTRTRDLVAQGFLSASRLDEAERALAVAQAQRDNAAAQQAANADSGTEVAQAQAQVAVARAASAAAQARLAQAEIVAPADARVLSRSVESGQIVQAGRALLSLALAGPLLLQAQVDERYLAQLQVGQTAAVLADAYPAQRFVARVQSIAPLVDAQRGAILVKFTVTPPVPDFLREDMTLSVEVETARRESALAVPIAALRGDNDDGSTRVLVARDGRVELRTVRLGLRMAEAAEVRDGLAAGEWVLIGPALAPGQRVRADGAAGRQAQPGAGAGAGASAAGGNAGAALSNAMGR